MTSVAGVRRQTVSVLFVDIVGFTTMVERMDCADVRALQMDYFATVSALVRRHGGVVEKYVGDAVMAVFGLSSRRPEGDAAAAVRAGLAVQQAISGVRLAGRYAVRTRAGVSTGEVMVDEAEVRDGGQRMISGRVVSMAAKLQALAPHDSLVACPITKELSGDDLLYQELPPAVVGGAAVDLFRALVTRTSVSAHVG